MSCDVGKATEGLENDLWRRWSDGRVGEWAELFFRFSYVTGSSLTSAGEPPMFITFLTSWSIASKIKGCVPGCCVFLFCSRCVFVKFTHLISMSLLNDGEMYSGNKNPTQHLFWRLKKITKNLQTSWFEDGTRVARLFYQQFAINFLKFAIWEKKSPNIHVFHFT